MENRKQIITVSIIALMILIIIGTTYAYFAAQDAEPKTKDVRIITDTTDSLVFEIGKDLSITANQDIFSQGKGNQSDGTTATATLKANSATNNATDNYYLFLNINMNNFVYTTEEKTPELILTVKDENGNAITSIEGLNPVTVGNVSGFDITASTGIITILNNQEITSNGTEVDSWNITITFVNLNSNQSDNEGKIFDANIIMQKDKLLPTIASYIKSQYTIDGEKGLYLHDGIGTYVNADQEAGDNSLRYSGTNPDNWVCFGIDDSTGAYADNWCRETNLFRIIGVFDNQVKLIKVSPREIGGLYWNEAGDNDWRTSIIKNDYFAKNNFIPINYDSRDFWNNMISVNKWIIGGNTSANILSVSVKTAYQNEIVNPMENITDDTKFGLMYVSDYGYAASPDNWKTNLSDYYNASILNNNWLWNGEDSWTITKGIDEDENNIVFCILEGVDYCSPRDAVDPRAAFYLTSDVKFAGGQGTQSNPYRVSL